MLDFIDGLDHYTAAQVTRKWAAIDDTYGTAVMDTGRVGSGQSLRSGPTGGYANRLKRGIAASTQGVFGFGLKFSKYPGSSVTECGAGALCAVGTATVNHIYPYMDTAGNVSIRRCDSLLWGTVTTLAGPVPSGVSVDAWNYYEFEWVLHATAGSAKLSINGVEVLSVSGVRTYSASSTAAATVMTLLGTPTGSGNFFPSWVVLTAAGYTWIDDVYVLLGSSGLAASLGDMRVDAHWPTSDGAIITFTPSTGIVHYVLVNDVMPDDDTGYNHALIAGCKDLFGLEAFKNSGSAIKGLQLVACAEKDGAGTATLAHVVRHNGADYDGDTLAPGASAYAFYRQVHETNPGTGVAFTELGFNACQYGYKKVA